jgi:hypothetical protein
VRSSRRSESQIGGRNDQELSVRTTTSGPQPLSDKETVSRDIASNAFEKAKLMEAVGYSTTAESNPDQLGSGLDPVR